jgi:hypothetical protein
MIQKELAGIVPCDIFNFGVKYHRLEKKIINAGYKKPHLVPIGFRNKGEPFC